MNEICKAERNERSECSEAIFSHALPIALKRGFARVYDNGTRPLKKRL